MNAEHDVLNVGVQMILMVEDSVRFYSSILPHLYKFLLTQSVIFSTEALNEHEKMLRMRGRPKVILARNYEEAMQLYEKFADKMLGLITDVSFMRQGQKDSLAGHPLRQSMCARSIPTSRLSWNRPRVPNRCTGEKLRRHFPRQDI